MTWRPLHEGGCIVCKGSIEHRDWSHAFCSDLCHESWQVEQALDPPDPILTIDYSAMEHRIAGDKL